MPFGPKNDGMTFQRLVNKMFSNHIWKNIKAYANNIVVKSKRSEQHIKDLDEVSNLLRKYKVKLNLEK